MIKLPLFIMAWVLFIMIKLPTVVFGWIAGLFMYELRHTKYVDLPSWTRPFANPEDWLGQQNHYKEGLPRWYYDKFGPSWYHWYRYNFWRNGANGLRSYEWIDLDIILHEVEHRTNRPGLSVYEPINLRSQSIKFATYIAWQGIQAGFKVVYIWPDKKKPVKFFKWTLIKAGPKHLVIKFGWRVEPSDGWQEGTGIGTDDASFASKLLLYRSG